MHFIFFTKTKWSEPPRIRHQLAKLLLNNGHQIDFFEKSSWIFPFKIKLSAINDGKFNNLRLFRTSYLIHHQLRIFKFIHYINFIYEYIQLSLYARSLPASAVIINFNYDFFAIRKIFPNNKIIYFLNDDFIGMLKLMHSSFTKKFYDIVSNQSDYTFSVSSVLINKIDNKTNSYLFYPWTDDSISAAVCSDPALVKKRKSFLIYGFIDDRLDYKFLIDLAHNYPNYTFNLAGPVNRTARNFLDKNVSENIRYLGVVDIGNINPNDYIASLLLYDEKNIVSQTIEIPNRAFNLLKIRLPLISYGLPNIIRSDVIFRVNSISEFDDMVNYIMNEFNEIQLKIEDFLINNSGKARYNLLKSVIKVLP